MPKISVVVAFYNGERTLERCLQALVQQDFPDYEIILVDNGSSDESAAIVRRYLAANQKLSLVNEPRRGVSFARNKGISVATGEWVVFTDADCVVAKDWLSAYARVVQKLPEDTAAVAGTMDYYPPETVAEKCLSLFTLPPIQKDEFFSSYDLITGGFPTANLAVKRSVLLKIGGFAEGWPLFCSGEDHDLCRRIYGCGCRIYASQEPVVQHIHRQNIRDLVRQALGTGRSHAYGLRNLVGPRVIVQLPVVGNLVWKGTGRVWLDLRQADKKMGLLVLLSLFWPWGWWLVIAYVAYLFFLVRHQAAKRLLFLNPSEIWGVGFCLLLKSAAITWGRVTGSLMAKVFCF